MTMTMKQHLSRKQKLTSILTSAVLFGVLFSLTPILSFGIEEVFATHCSGSCYAREWNSITTYGNSFTTKVTDLYASSDACARHITVVQWVKLPSGSWLENGFSVGPFVGSPCANNDEYSYHGYNLPGVGIYDTRDANINVGNTRTYEISDLNKDKTWYFKDNGSTQEAVYAPYNSGIGQYTGAETTHHSLTLPNTHLTDIKYADSAASWIYWSASNPFNEDSPLWIINCSPSYRHIHVGSVGSETCSEY
jgi:hypothetical protein